MTTPYSYIDTPNSNLVCCICRTPFVDPTSTRTCSHTFCHDCILRAMEHSPHCPVDRSSLSTNDLVPASSIVRNLVDELMVECTQRSMGCTHTCQRQLLASHLKDACQYVQVACSKEECENVVLRKDVGKHEHDCVHRLVDCDGCDMKVKFIDLESHNADCPTKTITCRFCSATFARSELVEHNASCPDFVIPCVHIDSGCPWIGPRDALLSSHIPSCQHESIKGFFPLNNARISTLTDENILLKYKVEMLENIVQTMRREMQAVKIALGPWYRPDGVYAPLSPQPTNTDDSYDAPSFGGDLSSHSPLNRSSFYPESTRSQPTASPFDALSLTSQPFTDHLAPYFPPAATESYLPTMENPQTTQAQENRYLMRSSSNPSHALSHARMAPHNPVAPINLSTTLEGSLGSLRESVVTLSSSVDSLARRHDIALTNETMRMNEELVALRTNMNGLRLQVHRIMMDRNAQVTGRTGDHADSYADGQYPPQAFYTHPPIAAPPFTKL